MGQPLRWPSHRQGIFEPNFYKARLIWWGQGAPTIEDYAEIIGTVTSATKIKMMTWINMGQDLGESNPNHRSFLQDLTTAADMKLANDLVEIIHGSQNEIKEMFF